MFEIVNFKEDHSLLTYINIMNNKEHRNYEVKSYKTVNNRIKHRVC